MTWAQLLIKNNNIFDDVAPLECAGSQYYFSGAGFPIIFFSFYIFLLFQEYIKAAHIKERQRLIKKTEDEKVCLVEFLNLQMVEKIPVLVKISVSDIHLF